MTAPVNIFTLKEYNDDFKELTFNQTIPLTSIDLPYFAVRSFLEKQGSNPLESADFKDTFKDISDGGWALIEGVTDSKSKQREFDFLEPLALAIQIGDKFYISKFAYLLYDPQDGIFPNYDSTMSAEEKKLLLAPFMRLFLTYILPGYWWHAFYGRQYLSEEEGKATMLNARLLDIEDWWASIEEEYGMPSVEDNA